METFFTADTHFDHPGVLLHCKRPWLKPEDLTPTGKWVSPEVKALRTKEMSEALIDNWNSTVGHKDQTVIVGDFAWRNHRSYVNRLHGKKILLIGSHDDMPQVSLQQFSEVHVLLRRRFAGHGFFIFHWPCMTWDQMHYGIIHLHGHCHARLPDRPNALICDVGVDVPEWNYSPVHVSRIIEKMKNKRFEKNRVNTERHVDIDEVLATDLDQTDE